MLGFVGLGLLGDAADPTTVLWLLFLTQLSYAFTDVCCDALVAANAKVESEHGAGNLQSLCWMASGSHRAWARQRVDVISCSTVYATSLQQISDHPSAGIHNEHGAWS